MLLQQIVNQHEKILSNLSISINIISSSSHLSSHVLPILHALVPRLAHLNSNHNQSYTESVTIVDIVAVSVVGKESGLLATNIISPIGGSVKLLIANVSTEATARSYWVRHVKIKLYQHHQPSLHEELHYFEHSLLNSNNSFKSIRIS